MAITTSLTWTANNLVREKSDDFIIKSHWYLVGKTFDGVVKFNTTRTGNEIPYRNVTEENVVEWIKTGIGTDQVAEYERLMHDNLIYIHKNNVGITTAGFPSHWSEPEAYISTGSAPLGITT